MDITGRRCPEKGCISRSANKIIEGYFTGYYFRVVAYFLFWMFGEIFLWKRNFNPRDKEKAYNFTFVCKMKKKWSILERRDMPSPLVRGGHPCHKTTKLKLRSFRKKILCFVLDENMWMLCMRKHRVFHLSSWSTTIHQ